MHYSANECHYCFRKSTPTHILFIAKCCKSRCNKAYCINCINSHFDKEFVQEKYKKDTWICYSCQDKCDCANCGGIDKVSKDIKNSKRKTKSSELNNKNQDSADLSVNNSARLQSQFLLKNDLDSSENKNLLYRQQSMQIQQKKQTQSISELSMKKSSTKGKTIKKDRVKSFFEQKNTYPPYLQKILQRKKLFYNFIQEKTKKPLQQLLNLDPETFIQEEKPIMTRGNTQRQAPKQKNKQLKVKFSEKNQQQSYGKKSQSLVKIEEKDKMIDSKKLKQIINNQMKEYQIQQDDDIELLDEQ